eukprot:Platyproteum_vivax@DN7423_c1_g1_i4.p1
MYAKRLTLIFVVELLLTACIQCENLGSKWGYVWEYKIVITHFETPEFLLKTLNSLTNQTFSGFHAHIFDDASGPESMEKLKNLENYYSFDSRFSFHYKAVRSGSAKTLAEVLDVIDPKAEDVLVFVDGDDYLNRRDALDILNQAYANDNVWLTFGSFVSTRAPDKAQFGCGRNFKQIAETRTWRSSYWVYSHLKTAKVHLYRRIDPEDIWGERVNGKGTETAPDRLIMYPMLEMAGHKHIKCI